MTNVIRGGLNVDMVVDLERWFEIMVRCKVSWCVFILISSQVSYWLEVVSRTIVYKGEAIPRVITSNVVGLQGKNE